MNLLSTMLDFTWQSRIPVLLQYCKLHCFGWELVFHSWCYWTTSTSRLYWVTVCNLFFSFYRADKGDSLRASYLHHLDKLNNGAVMGEISRKISKNENTLTVGCLYIVDSHTFMKAKLNNHGNLGALIQHEFRPRSFLTLSGAFNSKQLEQIPRFGLCFSLKPWMVTVSSA